jgi:hypothetical protein
MVADRKNMRRTWKDVSSGGQMLYITCGTNTNIKTNTENVQQQQDMPYCQYLASTHKPYEGTRRKKNREIKRDGLNRVTERLG